MKALPASASYKRHAQRRQVKRIVVDRLLEAIK